MPRMTQRNSLKEFLLGRSFFVLLVTLGNIIFWIVPSDVLELVAREQHVLCGRYSRQKFTWMLVVALISVVAIYIRTGANRAAIRKRVFAVLALLIGVFPVMLAADLFMRFRTDYPYKPDKVVYHRPAHAKYHLPYEDVPEARRSYPTIRPGYGRVECVLNFDANGFRNAAVPTRCEIVAVVDSFTEGSRVSDDQPWPVLLAKQSGKCVYNLGISGYSPAEYFAATREYGLPLKPRLVLCMLYEGNDFRSADITVKSGVKLKQIIVTSPILMALNEMVLRVFGPIGATAILPELDVLSWMPIGYGEGSAARYYAFAPKQLLELNTPKEAFAAGEAWFAAKGVLREFNDACAAGGAKLVLVYAPNKAHVVFPVAASQLPAEKVRAYAALRSKKNPPPAKEFMDQLLVNLEGREAVIREWAESKSIPFISLTKPMRDAVRAGRQPYFTYDQHWSPEGHVAAADAVAAALRSMGLQ